MRRKLLIPAPAISILFFFFLSMIPSVANAAQELERKLLVIVDQAPIFLEASAASPIIGILTKGTRLTSYGSENGLFRIMLPSDRERVSTLGFIEPTAVKVLEEKAPPESEFWGTAEETEFRGIGLDVLVGAGLDFFGGGDISAGVRGLCEELAAKLIGEGFTNMDPTIRKLDYGAYIFPEIAFRLGPRLAFSVFGEVFRARNIDTLGYMTERGAFFTAKSTSVMEATAFRPSVHVVLPLGKVLSIWMSGGPIFIRMELQYLLAYSNAVIAEDLNILVKDRVVGFQGGVALEARINYRIGAFLGVRGQYAQPASFEGYEKRLILSRDGLDLSEPQVNGTLRFLSRNGFPVLIVKADAGSSDSKNAVFDFSGIGAFAGFRIRF